MTINIALVAGAGAQFFDDSGAPLSGGLIYTYLAGSTTPATSYTSRDGLTPNTNPIVLNAGGRPPAEIWLTGGVLYKYVIKTSAGATSHMPIARVTNIAQTLDELKKENIWIVGTDMQAEKKIF